MTDEIRECYRLFELEPGAPVEAVKQAYRELLMVWHPDRFPDAKLQKKATEKTLALTESYQKITAYLSGNYSGSRPDVKASAATEESWRARGTAELSESGLAGFRGWLAIRVSLFRSRPSDRLGDAAWLVITCRKFLTTH